MSPFDPQRFPRLADYLSRLPQGFDSYPDCAIRGSNVRAYLDARPIPREALESFPAPVRSLIEDRPANSQWVPEVHFNAFLLTTGDLFGLTDEQYVDRSLQVARGLYQSFVMKLVMTFMSRRGFVDSAGSRWAMVHRGSQLAAHASPDLEHVDLTLTFPPNLWGELSLRGYCHALKAAVELVAKPGFPMHVERFDEKSAVFRAELKGY